MVQQLSGMNVIMFYSNTVFSKTGSSMSAVTITGIVGLVNFLTTFVGMYLLTKFGRQKIMFWCTVAIVLLNVMIGISFQSGWGSGMIGGVFAFIAVFEFGPGPITWLYMAEIMQDKAQGIATMLNWGINLLISYFVPNVIHWIGDDNVGYIFLFFAMMSFFGTFFIHFYMFETMGKSQAEIDEMFNFNKDHIELRKQQKENPGIKVKDTVGGTD